MKPAALAARLAPITPHLRCPQCEGALALHGTQSLVCPSRHTFDLAAKGYVNLAPAHNQQAEKYNAALFYSRASVFADGFYAHVADALCAAVARHTAHAPPDPLIVDAGCGEGYYARALAGRLPHGLVVGVDLSRDAVQAAARQAPALHWLVADLTRLPFQTGSVAALIDVLTPADYREFARVLMPEGLLYKAIPADDYLAELRAAAALHLRGEPFSNARVVAHLAENADVLERIPVRRVLPVTPPQAQAFARMSPMTFGLTDAQRAGITFTEITVAMELYVCRLKTLT
jgi:23S rRNA (guanine745-N1)-methyltransferase